MGLAIKPGVDLFGIQPELLVGLRVLEGILDEEGCPCVLTSVMDGVHGARSYHRYGYGVDVRSKTLTDDAKRRVLVEFRRRAPEHFDLLLEAEGEGNEHFHLEYDRKPYG